MEKIVSAEQMALRDIAKHINTQAQDIATQYGNISAFGYNSYGFADPNVCMVVAQMFVGATKLATRENRKLNRELNLHKINKS